MYKFWTVFLGIIFMTTAAQAALVTEDVTYASGDEVLKGYLVYDDALSGKRPGVIVVHEWWGHNAYARQRAEMLAELGYTALAVDMYGDGKNTEHPEDAGKFAQEATANMDKFKARFLAGLATLQSHATVDVKDIAAIGYCFGGGTVLNMARAGIDLKGVVSFHGSLAAGITGKAGEIKAKILVCHGEADGMVTKEQVAAFKKEMKNLDADYSIKVYKNAKHSFTNPKADEYVKLGLGYNEKADKKSWKDMRKFLKDIFKHE